MRRNASAALLSIGTAIALLLPIAASAAGPPYPDPVEGQAVYDNAGILSDATIAKAEATIDAIEARTAAEIVVYTELTDYGVTTEETETRARALIDQWGVGRRGFDDGLAIFFDIDPSLEHGQVQLYAAPGFEATFLTNAERQAIFDDDMIPYLRNADFDGALGVALEKVDAAATPENAARLETGRQINAVLGLIGAPIVFMGLAGWAFMQWRRYGKDPVYLDDPSILMPAPPPDLTAASGAFVMDGGTSRRALTTAMLDLASRGLISFREDRGLLGLSNKVGIEVGPPTLDPVEEARRALNARRPIGPAEEYALKELRELGSGKTDGFIDAEDLPKFGTSVSTFDSKLESHVVNKGWMVEKPSKVVSSLGRQGRARDHRRRHRPLRRDQRPDRRARPDRRRGDRGRHRDPRVRPGHARGDDAGSHDPGDARRLPAHAPEDDGAGTIHAAGRRRTPASTGSRRRTRPWSGAPRWGCRARSKRSSREASRTCASSRRWRRRPTSRRGTARRTDRRSRAASQQGAAAASSPGSAVPDLGGMMSALGTIGNSPASSGSSGGGGGSAAVGRAAAEAARAAGSSPGGEGVRSTVDLTPRTLAARVEALDLDRWPRPGTPARSSVIRKRWVSRETPCGRRASPRPFSS